MLGKYARCSTRAARSFTYCDAGTCSRDPSERSVTWETHFQPPTSFPSPLQCFCPMVVVLCDHVSCFRPYKPCHFRLLFTFTYRARYLFPCGCLFVKLPSSSHRESRDTSTAAIGPLCLRRVMGACFSNSNNTNQGSTQTGGGVVGGDVDSVDWYQFFAQVIADKAEDADDYIAIIRKRTTDELKPKDSKSLPLLVLAKNRPKWFRWVDGHTIDVLVGHSPLHLLRGSLLAEWSRGFQPFKRLFRLCREFGDFPSRALTQVGLLWHR